jgi:hypothetical protein
MLSPASFGVLFILLPTVLLIAVVLLLKKIKTPPKSAPYIMSALCVVLGIFFLVLTYNMFVEGKAIFPLKNASSFTKEEHPNAFVFCTAMNIAIGLGFLVFAARTTIKAVCATSLEIRKHVEP